MACFRKQKQASLSVRMSYPGKYRAAAVTKNITFQYKVNMYYVQLHYNCTLWHFINVYLFSLQNWTAFLITGWKVLEKIWSSSTWNKKKKRYFCPRLHTHCRAWHLYFNHYLKKLQCVGVNTVYTLYTRAAWYWRCTRKPVRVQFNNLHLYSVYNLFNFSFRKSNWCTLKRSNQHLFKATSFLFCKDMKYKFRLTHPHCALHIMQSTSMHNYPFVWHVLYPDTFWLLYVPIIRQFIPIRNEMHKHSIPHILNRTWYQRIFMEQNILVTCYNFNVLFLILHDLPEDSHIKWPKHVATVCILKWRELLCILYLHYKKYCICLNIWWLTFKIFNFQENINTECTEHCVHLKVIPSHLIMNCTILCLMFR